MTRTFEKANTLLLKSVKSKTTQWIYLILGSPLTAITQEEELLASISMQQWVGHVTSALSDEETPGPWQFLPVTVRKRHTHIWNKWRWVPRAEIEFEVQPGFRCRGLTEPNPKTREGFWQTLKILLAW